MDLRTLRYFTVTAQELNITRAAEKLNMSQPPLSHQIQLLEQELGAPLFLRGKRRLQLTAEGEHLLLRAQQLLDLADKTKQELREMKTGMSGTLYLGMVEGRAPYLSARWIAGFREEYPLVRYSLWNGSSDDVLERLHNGLADLAVIATPYDTEHLNGIPVGSEPWCAMIPADHPLARLPGETLPLCRLDGQPLIVPSRRSRVQAIRQWFGEIGAEPTILCEMSNFVDALALSEQGVGISIFPQTTTHPSPGLVSKIITEPSRQAQYVLVWYKSQQPSRLAQAFLEYVSDLLEEDRQIAPDPLGTIMK
jgi:DNA-binding transcriptional LysR family regulator